VRFGISPLPANSSTVAPGTTPSRKLVKLHIPFTLAANLATLTA